MRNECKDNAWRNTQFQLKGKPEPLLRGMGGTSEGIHASPEGWVLVLDPGWASEFSMVDFGKEMPREFDSVDLGFGPNLQDSESPPGDSDI